MRTYELYEHNLQLVRNANDEPVFIAGYVENYSPILQDAG
jgi:hypothetical protein